jgi:SET domain-containing protein
MDVPDLIEIKDSGIKGKGLFARRDIKKGEVIFRFQGILGDDAHTNGKSLQIDDDLFLESTIFYDDYLNHSCDPDCFIDWKTLDLVAKRDIKMGDEINFDYCTSDWDDTDLLEDWSFKCGCEAIDCVGVMKGFKHLTREEKKIRLQFISPFLMKMCKKECEKKSTDV